MSKQKQTSGDDVEVIGPQHERVTHLSTVGLVKEIAGQAGLLVKKQVQLARTELKADARTEAKVAGGVGVGAGGAIITGAVVLGAGGRGRGLGRAGWGGGVV